MKKFLSVLIINFLIFNVSFAETFVLYCVDDKLVGFDGDDQYTKLKNYKPLKFNIKVDMNNKSMEGKTLGIKRFVKCTHFEKVNKWDPILECMSSAYFIALNLETYKYTRSRGFGYAFSDKDDIGFGYGRCEKF